MKSFMKKNYYSVPVVQCARIKALSVLCVSQQGVMPQLIFTDEDGTGFSAD